MRNLVNPESIKRHPLLWGWTWAALTILLITLIDLARGAPLRNSWIAIPIWAVAGAAWGFAMKWQFGRRDSK